MENYTTVGAANMNSNILQYLKEKRKSEVANLKRFFALQKVIRNKELSTYFQPILQLEDGLNIGFEILNRPKLSKAFPSTELFYDFIGQTNQVYMFEHFCRTLSLERYIEKTAKQNIGKNSLIFINIHPNVLLDAKHKSGETNQIIKKFQLSPEQIVFELTEKQAVTDFAEFERVLYHYRSQGFRIAVDDAGSGYNSLKTLAYLKPEFLKIDKSIIRFIDSNVVQQQLVNMLVDFANRSNTFVIAEGIERIEELQYLTQLGVQLGQGYLLGKPKMDLAQGSIPISAKEKGFV